MVFTLRIVFYGLIAFVPNSQELGLTALILDSKRAATHEHAPKLWLIEGCYEKGGVNRCPNRKDIDELADLKRKEISILNLPSGKMIGLELPSEEVVGFPCYRDSSLKWIPQMESVEAAAGQVARECLEPETRSCRIAARFKVHGRGQAHACHFLHETMKIPPYYDVLHSFNFSSVGDPLSPRSARAIADALEVDFEISGFFVTLRLKSLDEERYYDYVIFPSADSEIILAITNQPAPSVKERDLHFPSFFEHFLGYYWLADSGYGATRRNIVPRRVPTVLQVANPGICEDVAKALDPKVIPHNKAECDAVMFRASPDG